jgi:hypothetical protein
MVNMIIPNYISSFASYVLSLSEDEQKKYWEKNVASQFSHGLYLDQATELSKKRLFNKWIRSVRKLTE